MTDLKKILFPVLMAALSAVFGSSVAFAQNPGKKAASAKEDARVTLQEDLADLTMEESLMQPVVPDKQKAFIKSYMMREAKALQKMGYKVETMRQGEVVIATIPCSKLFLPNDTTLMTSAGKELANFLPYFRVPGKFKVILGVHSDDSGSEDYLYKLTEKRVVALYDYFDNHATQTESLMGYPLGPSEPVKPNSSMAGRSENRRVEIFIVPGPELIAESKVKNR